MAATTMSMTNSVIPILILVRMLTPLSLPVTLLRIGTIILSYIGTAIKVPTAEIEDMEAAGILKLSLIFKFIAAACLKKECCALSHTYSNC